MDASSSNPAHKPSITPRSSSTTSNTSASSLIDLIAELNRVVLQLQELLDKDGGDEDTTGKRDGDDGEKGTPNDTSQTEKIMNNLFQIKAAMKRLDSFEKDFRNQVERHTEEITQLLERLKSLHDSSSTSTAKDVSPDKKKIHDGVNDKLSRINKEMRKLKHRIPSPSSSKLGPGASARHDESKKRSDGASSSTSSATLAGDQLDKLLSLRMSESFHKSSVYEEIKGIYNGLKDNEKKCLMSFVVFSENEELKKRMLTYWWAGEGFLQIADDVLKRMIEDVAGEILDGFVVKGLIEPVYKKRWPIVKAYRMQPVVRSAIIKLADELDYKYSVVFIYHNKNLAARFVGGEKPPNQTTGDDETQKPGSQTKDGNQKPTMPPSDQPKDGSQTLTMPPSDQPKDGNQTPTMPPSDQPKDGNQTPTMPLSDQPKDGNQTQKSQSDQKKPWDPEKVETIFNVNEPFPDRRMKLLATEKETRLTTKEWLLKMKAIKVLYLGSWRASGHKHHIEVDSTEFLEGVKNMSSLRLLSLQGISGISELTKYIKGLKELMILDLKACHTLEELPKEISWLKKLTHLDVSDCYLVDHMPKGLSSLANLQVLKGFVVGDYGNQARKFCTLDGLVGMKKLRKLSIVTSKSEFPQEPELTALEKLQQLRKLTLSWGAESTQLKGSSSSNQPNDDQVEKKKKNDDQVEKKVDRTATLVQQSSPWKLEKLDLQCYPKSTAPKWLKPEKLSTLEKLYIRGGRFGDENLGLPKEVKWSSVQYLRLTYLAALKMDWEEMLSLFPHLRYLEKVDCPLITMCPCDEDGVWMNHTAQSQRLE